MNGPTPDAVAALIAAAILDHLPIRYRHTAQRAAVAAVADLATSGWRVVPALRATSDGPPASRGPTVRNAASEAAQ